MPLIESDEDVLNKMLTADNKREEKDLDALKELFKKKEIEAKSELSIQQVISINQKRTIAKMLEWDSLNDCLTDFMLLMVSKDRKGRGEFVDAFKAERENSANKQSGFFNRIGQQFAGK